MASSKLMFAYFNLNLKQAEQTGYGQLKEMIDNCPYFQEHFSRDMKNDSNIKFPQANMTVRFASDSNHIIGTNLVAGTLDEANFYQGSTEDMNTLTQQNKASKLYLAIRNRRKISFYDKSEKINLCPYLFLHHNMIALLLIKE